MEMVSLAFNACVKNRTQIFTQPPARFVFVFQRVTVFIGDSVKAEHWFLGAAGTKTNSTFRQGVVFFRLRPREVTIFCLSLSVILSRVRLAIICLSP